MRFRILNKNPIFDYREACKITQGVDLFEEAKTKPRVKDRKPLNDSLCSLSS